MSDTDPAASNRDADLNRCNVSARVFEAYNAGNLEAMLALLDPDIELNPLRSAEVVKAIGRDGVAAVFRRSQAEGLQRFEIKDIRPLAGERVLATGTVVYAGAKAPFAAIHTIRHALVTVAQHFFSDEETLTRLGVIEPRRD